MEKFVQRKLSIDLTSIMFIPLGYKRILEFLIRTGDNPVGTVDETKITHLDWKTITDFLLRKCYLLLGTSNMHFESTRLELVNGMEAIVCSGRKIESSSLTILR